MDHFVMYIDYGSTVW